MTPRRMLAATIGTTILAAGLPAAAHADKASPALQRTYQKAYKHADHVGDPGRNIVEDGVVRDADRRRASEEEIQESLVVLRGMTGAAAPATAGGSTSAGPALESIAACESGGNPGAVDASGTYRGKYQFDRQTWASVGGSGDPAAAPEAEQDVRAQQLLSRSGSNPWPVCGG